MQESLPTTYNKHSSLSKSRNPIFFSLYYLLIEDVCKKEEKYV